VRESDIIAKIRGRARAADLVRVGIGDDAAVLDFGSAAEMIACCDLMVEGVHFRRGWASARLIGHKALAVTLSDIAAMGGVPQFALVSIAIPSYFGADQLDELVEGLFALAEAHGVAIVGGDTSSSPGGLFIDTNVIGRCAMRRAVTRGGATAGHRIYVTGDLGASALGLALLESGFRLRTGDQALPGDREAAEFKALQESAIRKHLAPEPRLGVGRALGEAGVARSMIDISDGLSTDLWHILDESGCGAVIRADAIPTAPSVIRFRSGGEALCLALHGGEEYELLFTADQMNAQKIRDISSATGVPITEIGEIVADGGLRLAGGPGEGAIQAIERGGYEHGE